METLAAELIGEGNNVQFVLVSDSNAEDFSDRTDVPTFRDPGAGQPAWDEMEPNSVKHDTFVYSTTGDRVLFWDASSNSLGNWSADIRAAVEGQAL